MISQWEIQLPAGRIELSTSTIYGYPTDDTLEVIVDSADELDGQVWLRGVTTNESSNWLSRLVGNQWDRSRREMQTAIDLAPDTRQVISIGDDKGD